MNKNIISVILIIILIMIGLKIISNRAFVKSGISVNPKNISVKINGNIFKLVDGKAEIEFSPGSVTKDKVLIFGEPASGDLDADGDIDYAILLQNNSGGSGTFYYAVLAINDGGNYRATETMFLGDRIAPQTVNIIDGRAVYNFAERKPGEPFSVSPSVGKSIWVHYDKKTNQIGEWVKDFEGDTNPLVVSSHNYKNTKYGFTIFLPESWNGYTVINDVWRGDSLDNDGNLKLSTFSGPIIYVRHPLWTKQIPRQDIPIMVFTIEEWKDLQTDKFHIGAAPINPSELGRNSKYVFGLPARYNFSYLTGYEEVDKIIQGKNFVAF